MEDDILREIQNIAESWRKRVHDTSVPAQVALEQTTAWVKTIALTFRPGVTDDESFHIGLYTAARALVEFDKLWYGIENGPFSNAAMMLLVVSSELIASPPVDMPPLDK